MVHKNINKILGKKFTKKKEKLLCVINQNTDLQERIRNKHIYTEVSEMCRDKYEVNIRTFIMSNKILRSKVRLVNKYKKMEKK